MRRAAGRFVVALGVGVLLGHSVQAAECTRTRYECALTYVEQQNFQAAIQSLTAELQQQPRNLNALNLLGIALTGAGQPQKAVAKFRQALSVNPRFYPARKNLAINEFDMKQFAEAEVQFNRVLKDAPGDEITHLYLGEISFGKKDLATAAKQYEKGRKRIALKAPWTLHYAECLLAQHDRLGRSIPGTQARRLSPRREPGDSLARRRHSRGLNHRKLGGNERCAGESRGVL